MTNSSCLTGTIRVSVRLFLCIVKACVATLMEHTDSPFFEDPIHLWVWKLYRPQLSQRKSPGGRRETTCYERQLGNPKAAAWTCLEQYPSSARLDTKHIITSCQRFSPLLKTNAAKNWRDYQWANRNTSIASYSPQKQLRNNDNSILHPN